MLLKLGRCSKRLLPIEKLQRVGGRGGCKEAHPVKGSVAAFSADLGGSSKYSSENLEGRSGERFHENSICS